MSYLIDSPVAQLTVSSEPGFVPVTPVEVERELRYSTSDDVQLVEACLREAVELVEQSTRRALATRTHILRLPAFPSASAARIDLPGGNIQSVTSVQYIDEDGATQTWGSENYVTELGTRHDTGRIGLADGIDWPDTQDDQMAVTITYVAGWASASAVPVALRGVIRRIAADLVENMDGDGDGIRNPYVAQTLAAWRIHRVG